MCSFDIFILYGWIYIFFILRAKICRLIGVVYLILLLVRNVQETTKTQNTEQPNIDCMMRFVLSTQRKGFYDGRKGEGGRLV